MVLEKPNHTAIHRDLNPASHDLEPYFQQSHQTNGGFQVTEPIALMPHEKIATKSQEVDSVYRELEYLSVPLSVVSVTSTLSLREVMKINRSMDLMPTAVPETHSIAIALATKKRQHAILATPFYRSMPRCFQLVPSKPYDSKWAITPIILFLTLFGAFVHHVANLDTLCWLESSLVQYGHAPNPTNFQN